MAAATRFWRFAGLRRDPRHERREMLPPGCAVVARWFVHLWWPADCAGEDACGGNLRDARPENPGMAPEYPRTKRNTNAASVSRPVGIKLVRCYC